MSQNYTSQNGSQEILGKRKHSGKDAETKRIKYDEWIDEDEDMELPSKIAPIPDLKEFPILQNHYNNYNEKAITVLQGEKNTPFYPQGDADGEMNIFWMDVFEESRVSDSSMHDGNGHDRFFLFGKRFNGKEFKSVCVVVENLYHDLWLLPHDSILQNENHEQIMTNKVDQLASQISGRRMRFAEKSYCFELKDVPLKPTKYVNLQIPGKYDPIHLSQVLVRGSKAHGDEKENPVFKHAFGANSTFVERFLIEKRIKGPSWLTLKNAKTSNEKISFCDEEYTVTYKDINQYIAKNQTPSIPFVKILSISTQTMYKDKSNIVVAISGVLHKKINIDGPTLDESNNDFTIFSCVYNPFLKSTSEIEKKSHATINYCSSEKEVLTKFAEFIRNNDPDVIVGHSFLSFHLNTILLRSKALQISGQDWSCYGKLRRVNMPKIQSKTTGNSANFQERMIASGRLIADTYLAAVEYLREKTNSLVHLAKSQLKKTLYPIDNTEDSLHSYFMNKDTIQKLVLNLETQCFVSIDLIQKLALLPLTRELATIAGNVWSRALTASRAERIEYLLLHSFYSKNYILPDKRSRGAFSAKRGKAKYGGGFVLEPKAGLYDKYVLLLDFNSLYPSLILQHNICFTTVERPRILPLSSSPTVKKEETEEEEKTEPFFASPPENLSHDSSVLPNVLKGLLDLRNQVKRILENERDPYKRWLYDIRQKALKLTANSCYGCLGFSQSRFYCEPLAELITRKGRELLQSTKNEIENNLGHNIIYGDTDSVMVLTPFENFQEASQLGRSIRDHINKGRKYLEIGIDGYFRRILLLKKKKYVAELHTPDSNSELGYSSKKEIKGVEIVRRDWCELSRKTSIFCVEQILSDKSSEDVSLIILDHLSEVGNRVRQEIQSKNIDDYVLYKGLSKMPGEYPDATKLPHVCVAQEMINQGKTVTPGMRIAFVICNEARNDNYDSISHRAYPVDEYLKRQDLSLDQDYYLGVQIFPPIVRLCQHIEGVTRTDIAYKLGIDVNKYAASSNSYTSFEDQFETWDIFQNCEPLLYPCNSCGKNIIWNLYDRLIANQEALQSTLLKCNYCQAPIHRAKFQNWIQDNIRKEIRNYYACNKKKSINPDSNQTVSLSEGKTISFGKLKKFEETYSSLQLRSYLLKIDKNVNLKKIKDNLKNQIKINNSSIYEQDEINTFNELRKLVKIYMKKNACNMIHLDRLFGN